MPTPYMCANRQSNFFDSADENDFLKKNARKNYIANQTRIFSITYGCFFCLIGIVLTTVEPFKACTKCENPLKIFIESFFIFMYSVSVIWILIMFILIIIAKKRQKVAIKSPAGFNRRLSVVVKNKSDFKNSAKESVSSHSGDESKSSLTEPDVNLTSTNQNQELSVSAQSTTSKQENEIDLSKFYFTYDYENGTGELYMRCGTAIFAMCTMIDRFLSLIQMIETYVNNPSVLEGCQITFIVSIVAKMTSILFIFSQCFFIFKYANIIINFGKNTAVIGLMHILCTNFCVFFRTVVFETVTEIKHHRDQHDHNTDSSSYGNYSYLSEEHSTTTTKLVPIKMPKIINGTQILKHKQLGCINSLSFKSEISAGIAEAQAKLTPYLYPCIIEYSLMCLTVFYILWSSIEQRYNLNNNFGAWGSPSIAGSLDSSNNEMLSNSKGKHVQMAMTILGRMPLENNLDNLDNSDAKKSAIVTPIRRSRRRSSHVNDKRRVHMFIVDCSKSTTGLFFGIFVLLLTIISLITFFIYKTKSPVVAHKLSEMTEFTLVVLSFIISIWIYIKFKTVDFGSKTSFEMGYNEALIILGLTGIYLFGFYSIVAIFDKGFDTNVEFWLFNIQVVSIIESTFQSVLIIDGLKMYTKTKDVKKNKPGRSLIAVLILIDVSLWLSETFSIKKYEMNTIQLEYYNIVFWSVASSISSPLAIFFRFHASVCLSDIWKTLYEYD